MKKNWLYFVAAVTMVAVALTFMVMVAPTANALAKDPTYSAGNLTGPNICNCPVLVGNCVCQIGTVEEPAPEEPGGGVIVARK